jgi:outer membrane protein TolC
VRRAALAFLLAAAAPAACATPPSPLETAVRSAAPLARSSFGEAAPRVFPDPAAATVEETMAGARRRGSLRLEDCVRTALAVNEDMVAGDEARLQALLLRDLAQAGVQPSVHMLLGHNRQDPASTGSSGGGSSSTSPVYSQWSLNVVQPLFQGFRELHAMRSQETTAEALAEDRVNLRRALATSVARAFFLAVEAEAEQKALDESMRLDEARVQEMTARAEQGLARRTEVLLQESRRETTRASLSEVRERRDAAVVLLGRLAGVAIDLPLDPGPVNGDPVPTREEALALALRLRPDLKAAERRAAASGEDLKAASAQRSPSLSATGNWYLDRWNYSEFATRTRWDMGLVLDWPVFAGGAFEARERIAESRIRQATLNRSTVLRSVMADVDNAMVHLRAGLERLEPLRTNERFARENLSLLEEEYRQGLATNLEVFTAQVQLQDATVGLQRQEFQSRLDRLEVFLAMGRDDVVGASPAPPGPPPGAAPPKEKP